MGEGLVIEELGGPARLFVSPSCPTTLGEFDSKSGSNWLGSPYSTPCSQYSTQPCRTRAQALEAAGVGTADAVLLGRLAERGVESDAQVGGPQLAAQPSVSSHPRPLCSPW